MPALDNPATLPGAPGAVLRPQQFARHARLEEVPAPQEWVHLVEKFWSVSWDLPEDATYASSLAPLPATNLTFEHGTLRRSGFHGPGWYVTGVVSRRRFDAQLAGRGSVVGIKFQPGGFAALTGQDASGLRDQVRSAADLLPGVAWPNLRSAPEPNVADSARAAEPMLRRLLPQLGDPGAERPELDRLHAAVDVMADRRDADIDAVAAIVGVSTRTLQRLFRRLVGVGPKWMLTRARLHDAIARLHDGYSGSMADLAIELGWFDQAHFIRDFTALVGVPPTAYRRSTEDGVGAHSPRRGGVRP